MKSNTFTTIILEAESGYLTQVDEAISLTDRIVAKKIALGKFDSEDNWHEISEPEGDEIKEAQRKLNDELTEDEGDTK